MPELPRFVRFGELCVKVIFELGPPVAELVVESWLVAEGREVEGLPRRENDSLFREIAILRIV
jgi:hypothetical protein